MRLAELKNLSYDTARDYYGVGRITRFEMLLRDLLNHDLSWPDYSPEAIVALRERFNLTQEGLAVLLRVSPKTIIRWETEGEEIPGMACIALCILDRLGDGIFDLMREGDGRFTLLESLKSDPRNLTPAIADTLYNLSLQVMRTPPDPFDKDAVLELQRRLKLSRREFAEMLDVSRSTIDKWESGEITPKGPALTLMKLLWATDKDILLKLK